MRDMISDPMGRVILFLIILLFCVVVMTCYSGINKKKEWMSYCRDKGFTEQDCRWEYERVNNGDQTTVIPLIIPMR